MAPWTAARQAPLSMEFFWQEYWLLLLLSRFSHVRLCATPKTAAHQAPLFPGILQARTLEWVAISFSNAWRGCHFLHQGIIPTQGLNLHPLHCRQILHHLRHQEVTGNVLELVSDCTFRNSHMLLFTGCYFVLLITK